MPPTDLFSRRDFSLRLASLLPTIGIAGASFASMRCASTNSARAPHALPADEISHNAEAIHQEVTFKASPKRICDVLTETKLFDKVVQASAAMKSGMITAKVPTQISPEVGGAFTIFGGHIVGRQIELMPAQRVVQAWRVVDWAPGVYSIAHFELTADGSGTKLVLDHTGFPVGGAAHYAEGWRVNYWEPMEKTLA